MWKYLGHRKNVFINLASASGGGLSKHSSGQLMLIVVAPPKVVALTDGDLFPNILVLLARYNAVIDPLLQLSRS